jgi:hypothetical protein
MVTLKVTETRFDKPYSTFELEAPRKTVAIDALTRDYPDRRFDPSALCALLAMHDDIRIGGPTWDVRFEFRFKPE